MNDMDAKRNKLVDDVVLNYSLGEEKNFDIAHDCYNGCREQEVKPLQAKCDALVEALEYSITQFQLFLQSASKEEGIIRLSVDAGYFNSGLFILREALEKYNEGR